MKIADFFQELWSPNFGTPRGSIRNFLAANAYADEQEVADYLRAGHEVLTVMGASRDALGTDARILGGDSIFTDGEWVWRGDLWFYLHTHHVELPFEFLEHIRKRNYLISDVDRTRLLSILDYVEERW